MNEVHEYTSMTRLRRVDASPELCVVVNCHTFVCAIPTRHVTHLALNDDVSYVDNSSENVVTANGELYAVANLGTLLELPVLCEAWVLLKVPTTHRTVPIALRTGVCLFVRQIGVEAQLPRTLFTKRGESVLGAFVADRKLGFVENVLYGLVLDVMRLWTEEELTTLAKVVERARTAGGCV